MCDTYRTIRIPSQGLFKDKGSRFLAYAFPVHSEEEIKKYLDKLKKEHHAARHQCYAWRLTPDIAVYRINDDGEPSGTAGKPILGQIHSAALTNVLIVVVRYFGGTLLGVSGLINAYRTASADAINNADIISCIVKNLLTIEFGYLHMNQVMHLIKEESLDVISTNFDLICQSSIAVRQSDTERIKNLLGRINGVTVKHAGVL